MKIAVNKKAPIVCFVLLIFSNISYAATQEAASVIASAPRNFDIVGMKLGMTVSEMEAAIKKHNSRINISKKPGAKKTGTGAPLGDYVFTMRGAHEPMEKIDIGFFTPPDSNVASSIRRQIGFTGSKMPTEEKAKADIFKKYGKPTYVTTSNVRNTTYYWSYDLDGKPIKSSPPNLCCVRPGNCGNDLRLCGFGLVLSVNIVRGHGAGGLVHTVVSLLTDYQAQWRNGKNSREFARNYIAQQKQKEQQTAAKGFSSASVSSIRDSDIVGVKLGMTVSAVEAAIKKYNSRIRLLRRAGAKSTPEGVPMGDYVDRVVSDKRPFSVETKKAGLKAFNKVVSSLSISVKFFAPPDSNVASSITRKIGYFMVEMPTEKNIKAALFEKYGEPTYVAQFNRGRGGRGTKYYWSYFPDGKPNKSFAPNTNCYQLARAKSGDPRKCGLVLSVEVIVGKGAMLVNSTLTDWQAVRRNTENTKEFVKNYLKQQGK